MTDTTLPPTSQPLDRRTQENVEQWLQGDYDEDTKNQIRKLLLNNPQEIIDSFYKTLAFGTGGLRGIMGVGCNRMNGYTVRAATQGLANYIAENKTMDHPAVLIGFDSRHHSADFAMEAAKVLAANKIKVFLLKSLRPVPLVSFGCRYKKCQAAIVVTASHNPPQYNGYKVYWADGGQVLPPHDKGIIAEVNKITDVDQVKIADSDHPLIEIVDNEIDNAYFNTIQKLPSYPDQNIKHGKELNVVYTSLHGSGITMVPQALTNWGFVNHHIVEEQRLPDGDFPTVKSPNPEEHEALTLGIKKMLEIDGDIVIGTDPDCDRMGIVVNHHGEPVLMTGNQVAVICLAHVCEALEKQGRMPENAAFIKTIVTTELFREIVEAHGKHYCDVLTGFKYIAQQILNWEQNDNSFQFIFGAEESYGYLLGTHARDKDAIIASALICEVALNAKLAGKTIVDCLHDLYHKYGVHRELLVNFKFKDGKEGSDKMTNIMEKLHNSPPKEFLGIPVIAFEDYLSSTRTVIATKESSHIDLPVSNVLRFWLADKTKITVRPSGTEPKIKLYLEVVEKNHDGGIDAAILTADQHIKKLHDEWNRLLS